MKSAFERTITLHEQIERGLPYAVAVRRWRGLKRHIRDGFTIGTRYAWSDVKNDYNKSHYRCRSYTAKERQEMRFTRQEAIQSWEQVYSGYVETPQGTCREFAVWHIYHYSDRWTPKRVSLIDAAFELWRREEEGKA